MTLRRFFAVVALAAVGLGVIARLGYAHRPADWRSTNGWREADYAQMARAFYREDGNPLHPRVDWRGGTSGLVESEFPILPWVASILYRALGPNERALRWISALFSVASVCIFWRLARSMLPSIASNAAIAVFSVNGLMIYLASAIQPEPILVFAEIAAASALWRWWKSGSARAPYAAAAWTAFAALAKASTAHLGLLVAWFVLRRVGGGAFRMRAYWVAGAIATLPPVLWYFWSRRIYQATGLSLGISNETHLLSWQLLLQPREMILGNLEIELRDVFSYTGAILALFALKASRSQIEFPVAWYATAVAFYVAAADTTGEAWAWYYHALSFPPACLLIGIGAYQLAKSASRPLRAGALLLTLATVLLGATRASELIGRRDHHSRREERYRCYLALAPFIPEGGKILVRGGVSKDLHGHPVAFNASHAFYWMDRQGWNYASDDYSIERIEKFRALGAGYWVADVDDHADAQVFGAVESRYRRLASCGPYALFDISVDGRLATPRGARAAPSTTSGASR